MNRVKAWFLLFRPWSFTATLVPFLLGLALAAPRPDGVRWAYWGLGLLSGILFQATVNLLNTWGDARSGVDTVPGAICTTPQVRDGLVSMRALLVVALGCALAAGGLGVLLCFSRGGAGGWVLNLPLLVAGFVGFFGSTNYSTGLKFKYHGLGVPFVAFLMGPLEVFVALALAVRPGELLPAVGPSAWMSFLGALLLCTYPLALHVCVIMHGNDMRDIPSDRLAGIRTVASLLGPRNALVFYFLCHVVPPLTCLTFAFIHRCVWFLLPLVTLPLVAKTLLVSARTYAAAPANPPWIGLERASGGIHFLFGSLYALAVFLAGRG